jgi:hypothetical protein
MNIDNTNGTSGANNELLASLPLPASVVVTVEPAQATTTPLVALGERALAAEESVRAIARFNSPRDRLHLSETHRNTWHDLAPMLPAARRVVAAEEATGLERFEAVLHATVSAAAETGEDAARDRLETMSALARRVLALPWRDQIGAAGAIGMAIRGPSGLDPTAELAGILAEVVGEMGMNVRNAARAGVNVQELAAFHGIADIGTIELLQQDAVCSDHPDSAGSAAAAGQNVIETSARFGITDPNAVMQLEYAQINSANPASAGFAVRAGGHVGELAQQHGITTEAGLFYLQRAAFDHAAMPAVENGEDAQVVIQRHGIVDQWLAGRLIDAAAVHQAALAENAAGVTHAGKGPSQP